jgi:hypothetical protein
LPPGSSYGSMPMISPPYSAPLDAASSYQGSSLGAPVDYPRSRSSSFSYSQGQGYLPHGYQQGYSYGLPQQEYYMGSAMSSSGRPVPSTTPAMIIIHKSRKGKHRRSRSTEPTQSSYRSSSSRY